MGDGVRHLVERLQPEAWRSRARTRPRPRERVAGKVVARIVLGAGGATIRGGLRRRLQSFRTGEQATGGNAGGDERAVVGSTAEERRLVGLPLTIEVLDEHALDERRSGWTDRAGTSRRRWHGLAHRVVAVIDEADVVRRADHVEVEHQPDIVALRLAQRVDIEVRTEEPELLRAEPHEA